jgi:hypothetical protein
MRQRWYQHAGAVGDRVQPKLYCCGDVLIAAGHGGGDTAAKTGRRRFS